MMPLLFLLTAISGLAFGYCWGHQNAWNKWELWTKDEHLTQKTRNRIAGLER